MDKKMIAFLVFSDEYGLEHKVRIPWKMAAAMRKGQEGTLPNGMLFGIVEDPWWDLEQTQVLVNCEYI